MTTPKKPRKARTALVHFRPKLEARAVRMMKLTEEGKFAPFVRATFERGLTELEKEHENTPRGAP
jgi:hypothetical protein